MKPLDYIYPVISGICLGLCSSFYFFALEWAEVSRVVGLESIYPLFVTIWSLIFLDDKIEPLGYVGIFFATFGGVIMSFDALRIIYSAIITNVASCADHKERYFEEEARKKAAAELNDADNDNYGACWFFNRIYGVPYRLRGKDNETPEEEEAGLAAAVATGSSNDSNSDYGSISPSTSPNFSTAPPVQESAEGIGEFAIVEVHKDKPEKNDNIEDLDVEIGPDGKKKKGGKCESIKNFLLLIPIPLAMSGNDFFAKVSVSSMPVNNVSALNSIGFGAVLITFAFSKTGRKHFLDEVKYNWLFGIISEALTILSTYLVIVGMTGLSAPIVSALSSLRPFFLLISETVLRISTDSIYQCIGFKLFPILFIVAGVILMTFSIVSE